MYMDRNRIDFPDEQNRMDYTEIFSLCKFKTNFHDLFKNAPTFSMKRIFFLLKAVKIEYIFHVNFPRSKERQKDY